MLREYEAMMRHCTFKAGGVARYFFVPETRNSLCRFLKKNTRPLLFSGFGSNLLVRDQGFEGVVISTKKLKKIQYQDGAIIAEAGVALPRLARFSKRLGFGGGEFLLGIPGTVGGGLAMNAGAFGGEIWDFVARVWTLDKNGKIHLRDRLDFKIGYRSVFSNFDDVFFLAAQFVFPKIDRARPVKNFLEKRRKTQPLGFASCGSVFKNPNGDYAARLIEKSALKGFCIGGACVSKQHANYILNRRDASAGDIEKLIRHIQKTVRENFNIALETEVQIV